MQTDAHSSSEESQVKDLVATVISKKETRENRPSMMRAQGNGLDFVSLFINKLRGDDWLFIISLNIMLIILQSKH